MLSHAHNFLFNIFRTTISKKRKEIGKDNHVIHNFAIQHECDPLRSAYHPDFDVDREFRYQIYLRKKQGEPTIFEQAQVLFIPYEAKENELINVDRELAKIREAQKIRTQAHAQRIAPLTAELNDIQMKNLDLAFNIHRRFWWHHLALRTRVNMYR